MFLALKCIKSLLRLHGEITSDHAVQYKIKTGTVLDLQETTEMYCVNGYCMYPHYFPRPDVTDLVGLRDSSEECDKIGGGSTRSKTLVQGNSAVT